tara:strand:+ start:64 stop:1218 length:1155 start_codon:yes stop_codon:yes gene_type:complete
MSEFLKVTKLSDRAGTGAVNFSNGFNINGSDSGLSAFTHTEGATEPSSPSNGDTWWDSDNDIYKVYMNNEWKDWLGTTAPTSNAWSGDRGIAAGRNAANNYNEIQRFDITTAGNSVDFGDLLGQHAFFQSAGSSSRTIFGGGYDYTASSRLNVMQYITPSSPGNATDFGDLTVARNPKGAHSNGTRLLFCGGFLDGGYMSETVDYVTVANTGNATDFGDLIYTGSNIPSTGCQGSTGDATRALHPNSVGGGSAIAKIDYFTYSTTGNGTDFGDLVSYANNAGCSDATRSVYAAGGSTANTIQYVTTQTPGNATDFGDLTYSPYFGPAGCANTTKGIVFGGTGSDGQTGTNTMNQFTIQTTANATDFADLVNALQYASGASGNAS